MIREGIAECLGSDFLRHISFVGEDRASVLTIRPLLFSSTPLKLTAAILTAVERGMSLISSKVSMRNHTLRSDHYVHAVELSVHLFGTFILMGVR